MRWARARPRLRREARSRQRRLWALALVALFSGCGRDEPEPVAPAPADTTTEDEPAEDEPDAPHGEVDLPPAPSAKPLGPSAAEAFVPKLEEGEYGCFSVSGPAVITRGVGTAEVVPHRGGYALALYAHADGKERVEIHAGRAGGPPRLLESIPLERATKAGRAVAPALASLSRGGLLIAYVDREGTVHARRVGRPRSDREVAARVDIRFPPALAAFGRGALLAYTAGEGVPSHVYVVRLSPGARDGERADVTPAASGASAPTFVRGAEEPTLAFVDARLGFSPIYTRAFGVELSEPIEPVLVRPLSHLLEPAQVVVARHRGRDHIGYTGRGVDLGSAIGWVRAGEDAALPASVVSPKGVGHLRVDVDVLSSGALLFAGDAPLGPEKGAPREVHLRVLDDDRLGEPIRIRGRDGTAARPSIAALGEGKVALAYSTRGAIELVHVECER